MKKHLNSNSILTMILTFLLIVIVTLVVSVVFIKSNPNSDNSGQSEEEVLTDVEIVKKATSDETYMLVESIAREYNEGNKNKAISMYETEMDKALSNEDYDRFFRLLSSISVTMTNNGDCAQLMEFLDSFDASRIPANRRVNYYGTVAGACKNCGYEEKQQMYEGLIQELYNNKEVDYYED